MNIVFLNSTLFLNRECWQILKYRKWDDCGNDYKSHFESGVRMGVGAYNLVRTKNTSHN